MRTSPRSRLSPGRVAPLILAIAGSACGAAAPTTTAQSTLPSITSTSVMVLDPPSVDPPSVDSEPSTTAVNEPPATVSLETFDGGDVAICDRLIAADFTDNVWREYRWEDQRSIVVVGDDYIDTTDAACVDGTIRVIEDDPQGNYPVIVLTEVDGGIAAREMVDGESVPLVVSNVEFKSGELVPADIDPYLADARNAGLAVVSSLIDADPGAFRSLLNDELIWFDDNAWTTPDEIMGFAEEDGFPWGVEHGDHDVVDYLFDHVPTVTLLSDSGLGRETVARLVEISGAADVVIYDGVVRQGVEPRLRLGVDLGRFALTDTAAGWRVIAL